MKTRRVLVLVCLLILIMSACTKKNGNITFIATIEATAKNSIMVTTSDNVGFYRANVGYGKDTEIDFLPRTGQRVEITILSEIRESYPVQVTAVKIKLMDMNENIPNATEYKKISVQEAKTMMDGQKVIVLDVRTEDEYREGHIENAILLPHDQIRTCAETLLPDKNAKVLVYCKSGRRSSIAAQLLIGMEYTNVYEFGGINDWPFEIVK